MKSSDPLKYYLFRTPKPMKSYSFLLLNNAFVDIISATASILAIARLKYLPEDYSQLFVFVGVCSHVGSWFCHLCQTVHTYFVCHSTVILLHSFCFRLYILSNKGVNVVAPSSRSTILLSFILYAPTILMMSLFYSCVSFPPIELLQKLQLDEYSTTWHSNITDARFMIAITFVTALSPTSMITIFIVRRRLLREIRKMSTEAKEHHANIAKALTYQMLLPAGLALACAVWLLNIAGICSNEASERAVMILSSLFALGSPLINLTFLPPYRRLFSVK